MKVCILVVDDELEIRDMLSRHFRFMDCEVETAENGKEALAIMAKTRVDIVISDILMPEMDGVELLRAIRDEYPMVHVIMITGYVTMENVLACMRHGADTCVFKPLADLEEIENAVRRAIDSIQRWLDILHELKEMKPAETG